MTPEEIGTRLASLIDPAPGTGAEIPPGAGPAAAGEAPGADPAEDAGKAAGAGPAGADMEATGSPSASAVRHSVSGGAQWARATVDVPLDSWRMAVRTARDDADLAMDFFDWLSAVDDLDAGFTLVTHLWSTYRKHGVLIRTTLTDRATPRAPSIVDVYPGAAWHERETHEMFGIDFPGHPGDGLAALLLPPEFEGHPLRKDFILATRVAKPWPGAKEPGESHAPTKRQPMRPPGVPDPREWGPDARPADTEKARPADTTEES